MKNKSGYLLLIRGLYNHTKFPKWLALPPFLCLFVLSFYLILTGTMQNQEIRKVESLYGKYTYALSGLEQEDVEQIKRETNTKQYVLAEVSGSEDGQCIYMSVAPEFFSFTNYNIVSGKMPQSEDEILAPKWYLFQLGIKVDEMVGAQIELTKPGSKEKCMKTVSGIYICQTEDSEESNITEIPVIIYHTQYVNFPERMYEIYVEMENIVDPNLYVEELQKKLWGEEEVGIPIFNTELLKAKGLTESGQMERRKKNGIFLLLQIVILLFAAGIQKNIISLCLLKWKNTIGCCKLLGIRMNQVRNTIILLVVGNGLFGALMGYLCGCGSTYILCKATLEYWKIDVENYLTVPHGRIIIFILAILLLTAGIVIFKMHCYKKSTAYELISLTNCETEEGHSRKKIFLNRKFAPLKMSLRNFVFYGAQKRGTLFTIVICIIMMLVLNIQLSQNRNTADDNRSYQYRFEVIDYFSTQSDSERGNIKSVYTKLIQLLEKNNCIVDFKTNFVMPFKLSKKLLSDEYVEQLKGTANGYVQYLNSESSIDVNLAVMGYSTQMLKQLAEMNGMGELYLKEGEALFLNRTTSTQDILHAEIKNCEGGKYSFQTNLFDDNKQTFYMAETRIVGMVKTLPVYPVLDKNSMCMIIDLESYHQKIFLLIVMMVICFFLSGINILMQGIYEMDTRQKDFRQLRMIGVPMKKQKQMLLMELGLTYLLGGGIGLLISKGVMCFLYRYAIVSSKQISVIVYILCCINIFAFAIISYTILNKKIEFQNCKMNPDRV